MIKSHTKLSYNSVIFFGLILLCFCQFQQMQVIQNPDEESNTFIVSPDFKLITLHSNNFNTLYIYECKRPLFDQNLIFQQKQQLILDAQPYSLISVSTSKNLILLASSITNTLKIFKLNPSTNLFYQFKSLKFNDFKYLSAILAHPISQNQIILSFKGQVVFINLITNLQEQLSEDYQFQQIIEIGQTKIDIITISQDGKFLALGGDHLQVNIYSYNNQTKNYDSLNAFSEGQTIKELRFSSDAKYEEFPYTLIARLQKKIKAYVYYENMKIFEQLQVINNHNGFINDRMNLIVQNHPEDDLGSVKLFKQNTEEDKFEQRQQLQVLMLRKGYFEEGKSNLILLGTNYIRTYRYCDIDRCENCEVINQLQNYDESLVKQTEYICVKCLAGFQQKQGVRCLKCSHYPTICLNCQSANKCTKCAHGFTLGLEHFCIPCHIDNCIRCHQLEKCDRCQDDYDLDTDQNLCQNKNEHISLAGIIIGTIIGAVIIIFVAVYVLYKKTKNKKKLKKELMKKHKKSLKGHKNTRKGSGKQSLLYTKVSFGSVYENYQDSSNSSESENPKK